MPTDTDWGSFVARPARRRDGAAQAERASLATSHDRPTPHYTARVLTVLLVTLGILLIVAGLIGCIAPVIPGPPISFVGLLLAWGARGWDTEVLGWATVLVLGVAVVLVTILDTVAPVVGARRYGASSAGIWGSVIGMVVGILGFLPVGPLGMLAGAFLGAWVGELFAGKEGAAALRAAWGVFMGTVMGIVLKLVVSLAITFYFVRTLLAD